jgi:primosomal protein N'
VVGWACECGHALQFEDVRTTCPECGKLYEKQSELGVVRLAQQAEEPGLEY